MLVRYLYATTHYYDSSPYLKPSNFPRNNTTAGLAEGIAEAHKLYNVAESVKPLFETVFILIVFRACVLFVVQSGERNIFDQRWLEYELLERYGDTLLIIV